MSSDEVRKVIAGLREGDEVEADFDSDRGPYMIRGAVFGNPKYVGPKWLHHATAVRVIKRAPLPEPLACAVCGEPVHENTAEVVHTYGGIGPFHLATLTSLSGPAAVRTSEPEPPTSVAPAGEDHGATIEHVDTCRTCRDEIEAEQPEPADPPPTHTCAIGNFADCEGCKWDATLTPPEPHLHYCDCPDCAFADQVSKAVHLLKTIGLDITYTDEGLAIVARQIIRMGLRQALESVQGMRGLTLDGPRMQVHAEERIKRLLRTDTPAVLAATPGGDDE